MPENISWPFRINCLAFIIFVCRNTNKMFKEANGAFLFASSTRRNGFFLDTGTLFTYSRETTLSLFHIFIVKPAKTKKIRNERKIKQADPPFHKMLQIHRRVLVRCWYILICNSNNRAIFKMYL